MCSFTLFLKSEERSGFVFANTCYQKDINLTDKNKTKITSSGVKISMDSSTLQTAL